MPSRPHSRSKSIALGGLLSALATVILLAGGLVPVGTFAAPIFAGICLLPVAVDVGAKWALLCYLAVSGLAALLVPDLELKLFFLTLLGWYPIAQPVLNNLKYKAVCILLKLLLFNGAVALVYSLMLFLFTSAELLAELAGRAWWFWAGMLAAANVTFLLYDNLLVKARLIYTHRLRRHFFH